MSEKFTRIIIDARIFIKGCNVIKALTSNRTRNFLDKIGKKIYQWFKLKFSSESDPSEKLLFKDLSNSDIEFKYTELDDLETPDKASQMWARNSIEQYFKDK